LRGITDRLTVRKETIKGKGRELAKYINNEKGQFLIWCGLNAEADFLEKEIPDAMQLSGKDMKSDKIQKIEDFKSGKIRVLITKPKIAGFGMNFQNCYNMVFMGLSDSFEYYYQCIRRCWRFGQKKPVKVLICLTHSEHVILDNVREKERQANALYSGIVAHVSEFNKMELGVKKMKTKDDYTESHYEGDGWELFQGDCCDITKRLDENLFDLSVFSPPFLSLYTYSPSERDIGNCKTDNEFWDHFKFLTIELLRVMKEGRLVCCHVAQVPAMLVRDGYIGLKDFRGDTIRHFIEHGFIYHGEVCIDKNPQAQSIRTHAKGLTFSQLEKDSSWMRPALADYILLFRKPGDNKIPVKNGNIKNSEIDRDEWIRLAHPIWYNIRETETLNYREARSEEDE